MTSEKDRYCYHAEADPQLRFWVLTSGWSSVQPESITPDFVREAKAGLVTYPSGEILCQFGIVRQPPPGTHYMRGPVYADDGPGYDRALVRNGKGGVEIAHGPSISQSGDPRQHYSTTLINLSDRKVRVTKFATFARGMLGIKREPIEGYYSPIQFREWYRVPDSEGWIEPNEHVCDPDNYGNGNGVWAYFFEDDRGGAMIATAPLGNKP